MLDAYWQTLVGDCDKDHFDKLQKQFYDFDRNTKRFRMLHWTGVQNWRKTYIAASYAMLTVSAMSDTMRGWLASPLTGGYVTREFTAKMALAVTGRMIKTQKGYIGLKAEDVQPGDSVVFIKGGEMPLILRKTGSELRLVGDAYIHGAMAGSHSNQNAWKNCVDIIK